MTWSAPAPCGISQFAVLVLDSSACTASCLASMLSALPCLLTAQLCTCQSIQVCTQHHSRFLLLKLHACVRWMHQSYAGMKLQIHITKLCCLGPFLAIACIFSAHSLWPLPYTKLLSSIARCINQLNSIQPAFRATVQLGQQALQCLLILCAASEHYLITKA